jgi:hypothetical protein
MSTLGKVLTFLNVLVAIILLVLAGMDYAEWRGAHYAAFRHEMVIRGLPVDDTEFNAELPDDPIVERLTPNVLVEVFKGADGGPDLGGEKVKTVMEELARVQAKVQANISGAPKGGPQRDKIRGYLLNQARDVAERDEYKKIADKEDDVKALEELNKRFNDVKFKHGAKGSENWQEVRYAAAELFVNLSFDDAWLERVRVVLGIDPLTHGLDFGARNMAQLAAGVKQRMIADQGVFMSQYNEWVGRLEYEAENLYQANKKLKDLQQIAADRQMEVEKRQTEVNNNKTELKNLTDMTNAELAKLKAIEDDLFAIQRRFAQALEATEKLDEQLRQRAAKGQ